MWLRNWASCITSHEMGATEAGEKLLLSITELLNINILATAIEKKAKQAILNRCLSYAKA